MDTLCKEFLSCTGLPVDEDGRIILSSLSGTGYHSAEGVASSEDVIKGIGLDLR